MNSYDYNNNATLTVNRESTPPPIKTTQEPPIDLLSLQGVSPEDFQRELQNEARALEATLDRYLYNLNKALERNQGSKTLPARFLINRLMESFVSALDNFIDPTEKPRGWNAGVKGKVRGIISKLGLSPEELALTTLKGLLDEIMSTRNKHAYLTQVLETIATYCLQTHEYLHFKKEAPEELKELLRFQKQKKVFSKTHLYRVLRVTKNKLDLSPSVSLGRKEKIDLGGKLMDILIQSTGAFEYELNMTKNGKHKQRTIKPTEATNKILNESPEIFAFLNPMYPIMVCPPKPWTGLKDGGYWLPGDKLQAPFVKQPHKVLRKHADDFTPEAMPKVYEAVNHIQNTPWRINQKVYDVMKALWNQGGDIAGIPKKFAQERPLKPWGEDCSQAEFEAYKEAHPDIYEAWRRQAREVENANHKNTQERVIIRRKLEIADRYKDEESLYFPHYVDFRGRVYPLPSYVTPQGDDSGKALLEFAEGKPISSNQAADWLAIHGANLAGQDKLPFEDRIAWVHGNFSHIIQSAKAPLDYLWWTEQDDKPFQFLAFCFEWTAFRDWVIGSSEEPFISHLPIAMDGTCNGLQHLSAMLLDKPGGEAVNLLPSETPSDIYTLVLNKTRELIKKDIESQDCNETSKLIGSIWLQGDNLSRKVVKRPVMTTPYGVKLYGIRDQLREFVPEGSYAVSKYAFMEYLSNHLVDAINEVIIAANEAMSYMQEIAKMFCKETGEGVNWRVPLSGFNAVQRYYKQNLKRVDVFQGSQRIQLQLNFEDTSKINPGKQVSGISPNFIHSLDAAMLMQTVLKAKEEGITSLALIHDSYGTHAADCETLYRLLREAFIDLYSSCGGDVLRDLRNQLQYRIEVLALERLDSSLSDVVLPEPPSRGSLNIYKVMDSPYFFS